MLVTRWLAVCSFLGVGIAQEWRQLPSTAHPPSGFVAMAFDPVRQRTVCCSCEPISWGPWTSAGRTTTWEWDGARWLHRAHAAALSPTPKPIAMAWDGSRQKVVLTDWDRELWAFDGADWQLEMPGVGHFEQPSLAFDPTRGVLVCADFGALFEEQNGVWVHRAQLLWGTTGIRVAFDAASSRVIAFGGINPSGIVASTWSWDGTTVSLLAPATSPPGRVNHALTVDPATARPVLCGGSDQFTGQVFDDVWEWNGSTWVAQAPLPQRRENHGAAPFANEVLVFGGHGPGWSPATQPHELLRRTAGTFATVPLPLGGRVAAFDPVRARTVSVGASTFEFDGYTWIDTGIVPPPDLIALAGHVAAAGIVGVDSAGTTWLYDGVAWSAPALTQQPPARASTALALDPVRNRVVLFGGTLGFTNFGDVWEWDGATWVNPLPATSPPAGGAVMGWDPPGQRLVVMPSLMYANGNTYTWDGGAWTAIAPSVPGNRALGLAGHAAYGPVLLTSPLMPGYPMTQSWLLVGNGWVQLAGGPDDYGAAGSLVFDPHRGEVVLHDWLRPRSMILTLQAADSLAVGAGCPGANGVPQLLAANLPQLGAVVRMDVLRAGSSSVAFLLADLASASVTLPGGCTQLVANPIVLATTPTNAAGFASATWPVPASLAVRGVDVHTQALALDPNGALLGFASLTGAVQLRIGD